MSPRRALVSLLGAATAIAAPPPPLPPPPVQFAVDELRVAGRLLSVHAEDLDGDGRRDLLAIYVRGAPPRVQRALAVFYARGDAGAFAATADQVIVAPVTASFVAAADVVGDRRREIVFGDAEGLAYFAAGAHGYAGAPVRLLAQPGLALLPDEEELPYLDVARAWSTDGAAILLPLVDRLAVITRDSAGAWARTSEVLLPPRAAYAVRSDLYEPRARNFWMRVALTVPELHVADFDGDGRPDLIAVLDDLITVFRGQPGGAAPFAREPLLRLPLSTRTAAELERGNAPIQVTVRDLDGDGVVDLVVNKVTGGLAAMRGQTAFYYGRRGGGFGPPVQVMAREGFAGALQLADLDGDGKPELILCHASVGFAEAVRAVLSRKLALSFGVHKNLGAKGFAEASSNERVVDVAVDYSSGAELDSPFPTAAGDFNGDGRADFVAPLRDGGIGVWLGGGKGFLAEYPKAIVRVPVSRYLMIAELGGDRVADLVLFSRNRADGAGRIVVLRNTGRGW